MAQFKGLTITQAFGTKNPSYRLGYHPGTDFAVKLGQLQPAFADGTARYFYAQPTADPTQRGGGYGNTGTITLPNGDVIFYAHLADNGMSVVQGSQVKAGQNVFKTGNTGWINGVHAHIEYRLGGDKNRPVDITKKLEVPMDKVTISSAEYEDLKRWKARGLELEKKLPVLEAEAKVSESRRVRLINAHNALKVDKDVKV